MDKPEDIHVTEWGMRSAKNDAPEGVWPAVSEEHADDLLDYRRNRCLGGADPDAVKVRRTTAGGPWEQA